MRNSLSFAIAFALCGLAAQIQAAEVAQPEGSQPDAPASNASKTDADAHSLDTIVVTGRAGVQTRTKEQTSYSITTIDEDHLRLQAPTSVTESLKSVPGFWVEATGGEASGNVRARGIPVDGFGSINLLEDGLPIQHDPSLGYLNGDQAFRLDETIESVEVVRGGPSSLFYSNAPAGAVNYIPRRVGEEASGVFKLTAGDYGLGRGDFWYGTPLGDGWKLSFGGFYRKNDGIRDPGYTADRGGQLRATIAKEWEGGQLSFDFKRMVDTVYFDLGVPMRTYPDGTIKAAPGFDGNYGTLAGPETNHLLLKTAAGTFDYHNDTGTQVHRSQATWKFEQQFGDWKFNDSARIDTTDTVRNGMFPNALLSGANLIKQGLPFLPKFPGATGVQLRYVDSPSTLYDAANQNGNGLAVIGGLRSVTSPTDEIMNDARLSTKFDLAGQHDLTLGWYLAHVNLKFDRFSSSVLLDVRNNARLLDMVAVDANGNVVGSITQTGIYRNGYEWANAAGSETTHALYLGDEWQVSEPLRIDGGLRFEKVQFNGNSELKHAVNLGGSLANSQILTGTGQIVPFDRDFDKVGWTLGANWQFGARSGMFGRWTRAFRLPNVSSYIDNPTASPIIQTMDLGEVGYKYASRYIELYATGFYTKYDNVGFTNYVFDPNSPQTGTNQTFFAGTRTYGLELEGGIYPVEWFDLSFTATLENPEYQNLRGATKRANGPVLFDYSGNQLIRVPKNSVRIVPGLNLLDGRLRLQVAAEYEGARYVDTANTVRLPSYETYNASAQFKVDDRITLFGYVDNITNSQGLTEGNPRQGELQSADAGANTFLARPLLGRAYRVAIMYKF